MAEKIEKTELYGVFKVMRGKKEVFLTRNLVNGEIVYDEELIKDEKVEYRTWDPWKSKLCASIVKGSPNVGIKQGSVVLYLGCSTGTTVSHISDIVGKNGLIFAVDIAPRVLRDLVFLCERRWNIAPILESANNVDGLKDKVCVVDIVYQDIAQRDQAEIFLKNCRKFLRPGGYALLAVKARSVDVAKKPKQVFKEVRDIISKELALIDSRKLIPYQKDHCMFICKKKEE